MGSQQQPETILGVVPRSPQQGGIGSPPRDAWSPAQTMTVEEAMAARQKLHDAKVSLGGNIQPP
jgi:hypothetical protein